MSQTHLPPHPTLVGVTSCPSPLSFLGYKMELVIVPARMVGLGDNPLNERST